MEPSFLAREIMEPSYFAPQNYGAMLTLPRKITETWFQGKITKEIILK